MLHKRLPTFFAGVLILSLAIGMMTNIQTYRGGAILVVSLGIMLAAKLSAPWLNQRSPQQMRVLLGLGLGLMLIGQLLVLKFMPVTVFHDPFRILAQADYLAAGGTNMNTSYLLRNGNNIPITFLLATWLRLTTLIGLNTNAGVQILSLLLLDGFISLLISTIWRITRRNSLTLAVLAFSALTPFAYTYYLQVFYSDLPTLLILLVIFRSLMFWPQHTQKQRIIIGIGLTLISTLGAIIKPNLIVIIPASLILMFVLGHKRQLRKSQLLVPLLLIMASFGLSQPVTKGIEAISHYQTSAVYTLPITHWINMGLNPKTSGEFDQTETDKELALPNQKHRQQYTQKQITARLKQLGPTGLINLWYKKLGVLFDSRTIQEWYNGGFRSAPTWYQNWAQTLQNLTAISYAAASISLWAVLIWRLWTWRPDLRDSVQVGALLAVITALGYLAFHTLLWEAEARYGQAILPLLWLILAAIPAPATKHQVASRWWPLAWTVTPIIAVLWSFGLGQRYPQTVVTAAQRSQLSTQYQSLPLMLDPGETLQQSLTLNGTATYFSVQTHDYSKVRITLTKPHSNVRYTLVPGQDDVQRLHQTLMPGQYQIRIINPTNSAQMVDIVTTYHYFMTDYPLIVNHQTYANQSLIYTSMSHHQRDETDDLFSLE